MKAKKIIILICLIASTLTILCGCSDNVLKDDTQLRKEGKNIVISYDCGRYSNTAVTLDEDVKPMLYGKASHDDEINSFYVGRMGNYQIRNVYCTESCAAPEPGEEGISLKLPAIERRVLVGWYVASVIKWKTDDKDEVLRNKYGQKVYDYCIPQENDIEWDFETMRVGTYENHPYAEVSTLKDYDNINLYNDNIGAEDLVAETDETLGYNAKSGYNIYLYAKWKPVGCYVVMWHSPDTQQWEEIKRYDVYENDTYRPKLSDISKLNFTYYNVYKDAEYNNLWDESAPFDSFDFDENRPYVKVYVKYLVGNWNVVRTKAQLNAALFNDRNIYLDNDIEFSGEGEDNRWKHSFSYSAEFNGNNHTITFSNACIPELSYKRYGGPAITTLFGLFGEFKGNMHDVTFVNVEVLVQETSVKTIYTGVLFGSVRTGAQLNNIVVSGKVSFAPGDWKDSCTIYNGEGENAWYGIIASGTYDVTFTQTV